MTALTSHELSTHRSAGVRCPEPPETARTDPACKNPAPVDGNYRKRRCSDRLPPSSVLRAAAAQGDHVPRSLLLSEAPLATRPRPTAGGRVAGGSRARSRAGRRGLRRAHAARAGSKPARSRSRRRGARARRCPPNHIFGYSKCARALAGRRNKDPRDVVPPHFLQHTMRSAPCWPAQQGPARCGPTLFFIAWDARGSLLSWEILKS